MTSASPVQLGQRPSQERIESWVRAAATGDPVAAGALFEAHNEPLMNWLYRVTRGDRYLAEEVAQDTWETTLRKIKDFDPEQLPFMAWLRMVAKSRLNDAYRRQSTRRRAEIPADLTVGYVDEEVVPSAESVAEARQGARDAVDRLRGLNPRQATLIALVEFDGLTLDEAARELGIARNTAKVAKYRGIVELRKEETLRGERDTRHPEQGVRHTVEPRRTGSPSAIVKG